VGFNREARAAYLRFATGGDAIWPGNFRDLGASITRMATLAEAGRITLETVQEEIGRLRRLWAPQLAGRDTAAGETLLHEVLGEAAAELDRFDRVQLAEVLRVCRECRSLSEAGRRLFNISRERKRSSNDADRLRKYLARFGLSFESIGVNP
jgi:transcriptional regulatory protein RtcR